MAKRRLVVVNAAAALLFCPAAAAVPRVQIVAFGIYAPSAELGRLPARYRQHSIVPVSLMGMPRLLRQTDRIEARLCTRFGLQYRATGFAPSQSAVVEMLVTHPMLTRPDGRRSDTDRYELPLGGGIGWTGFDFDEAWELAPGTWTFSLLQAGQILARQRFTVEPAPAGAAAPKTCSPPVA